MRRVAVYSVGPTHSGPKTGIDTSSSLDTSDLAVID